MHTSQHFQGLRRSQQKLEATTPPSDNNPRKIDPTENPITRRPGPGRGRPRKSTANAAAAAAATAADGTAPSASPQAPDGIDPAQAQQQPLAQQIPPQPMQSLQPLQPLLPMHPQQQNIHPLQPLQPLPPHSDMDPGVGPAPTPMMESAPVQMHAPLEHPLEMQAEDVFSENVSEEPEEHAAKRAKLEENHDPALNDEAMLSALAAHNNPDMAHYDPE